jgi:hypothetical protein
MNNIAEIRPPHIHFTLTHPMSETSSESDAFRLAIRKEILHELNELHPTWEIGAKEGRCAIRSG